MVEVRIANEKNLLKIFEWRNTDFVKRLGSLDRKVRIEEPTKWFKSCLKDPNCKIFIISDHHKDIEKVRFNKHKNNAGEGLEWRL